MASVQDLLNQLPPGGSASTGSSSSSTSIVPGMLDVYNQLLGLNQQNYGNVLNAYASGQGNLAGVLPGITAGYGQVQGDVLNTLGLGKVLGQGGNWGVAQPAADTIARQAAATRGATDQQLINSGFANSSLRGNLQNQNTLQENQAYGALGAQLAQTAAGYQSQLGLAKLGQQMQGLGLQTGLYGQQGGALAGYGGFANKAGSLTGGFGGSQQASASQPFKSAGGYGPYSPYPNVAGTTGAGLARGGGLIGGGLSKSDILNPGPYANLAPGGSPPWLTPAAATPVGQFSASDTAAALAAAQQSDPYGIASGVGWGPDWTGGENVGIGDNYPGLGELTAGGYSDFYPPEDSYGGDFGGDTGFG